MGVWGGSRVEFAFEERDSDSPLVELVWRTEIERGGTFTSTATSHLEMVITRQKGVITVGVRGPETKASPAPVPEAAEVFGIQFKLGTFMPYLPASELVDNGVSLPEAGGQLFWLQGAAWTLPDFENADTFVQRLVRQGALAHEPIVEAALRGQVSDLSARSVQRRVLRATGVTQGTLYQIERAKRALMLLQQGTSILDTVEQAGYYDQPHLTRSLKYLMGQTPAQISDIRNNE